MQRQMKAVRSLWGTPVELLSTRGAQAACITVLSGRHHQKMSLKHPRRWSTFISPTSQSWRCGHLHWWSLSSSCPTVLQVVPSTSRYFSTQTFQTARNHSLAHHLCPPAILPRTSLWQNLPMNSRMFLPGTELSLFPTTASRLYASQSGKNTRWQAANRSTMTYMVAVAVAVVGLSYAAVPLYRLFCQASGYGGTVIVAVANEKVEQMVPDRERELTIRFNSDKSAGMQWQFKPQQREVKLVPGETALAFYTARNPTNRPITGIATYNVIPFEAGLYFNKIQCFCFEEQRLNPKEQVDMPVFFYIDPEFSEDPAMAKVDTITLSYTFFEAKDGETLELPLPNHSGVP